MNYYNEIKNILVDNIIGRKVREYKSNQKDLEGYYNVGKLLIEAQGGETRAKYGNQLIKEYSERLTNELGKGFSIRSLKYMRKFYLVCQKGQSLIALFIKYNVSWTFVTKLLKLTDICEIEYYIKNIYKFNLTTRELDLKLKTDEYDRLDDEVKEKLSKQEVVPIKDTIPNPVVLNGLKFKERLTEKILQKYVDENPVEFCKSLGEGYTYVDSQYKIKIGNYYNYIDVLLFNVIDMNYVVVELKITELKKEYIGQIETYMNYIDLELKKEYHNKTNGVILCRKDNKWLIKYINSEELRIRRFITSDENICECLGGKNYELL